MILEEPMPFAEALDATSVRSLLPTTGATAELRLLEPAIRRRAMFSATVDSASRLQRLADLADDILTGDTDLASARLKITQALQAEGYQPGEGKAGTLQDLSSERRINLQLETNVDTARGFGNYLQGTEPDVLDEWPAQELVRIVAPKGATRDWASRWAKAGGEFHGNRMIALKTDGIWQRLGDSSLFPDGLDNPYPPFAFNSGMDVRDVARDEAEALGLIQPGEIPTMPDRVDFNADLQASPDIRAAWLHDALAEMSDIGEWRDGVFVFRQGGDA